MKELRERDSKRDLGAELLESVRQMMTGQKGAIHQVVEKPLTDEGGEVRELSGADMAAFKPVGELLPELKDRNKKGLQS
ncbi:MAG: hypothetical protein KJ914_12135 [Gammaproteobacteria bacterium]|nr:hypothetical protein [Gammaproteobacteria bacterium]MBU1722718.1 hypothetical protein [Gammaproteobacteria bacterium]MBU2005329.1 hypothetical protein [Gammaproteobacteria bacterium]